MSGSTLGAVCSFVLYLVHCRVVFHRICVLEAVTPKATVVSRCGQLRLFLDVSLGRRVFGIELRVSTACLFVLPVSLAIASLPPLKIPGSSQPKFTHEGGKSGSWGHLFVWYQSFCQGASSLSVLPDPVSEPVALANQIIMNL